MLAAVFRGVAVRFEPIGSLVIRKDHHFRPGAGKKNARALYRCLWASLFICWAFFFTAALRGNFYLPSREPGHAGEMVDLAGYADARKSA